MNLDKDLKTFHGELAHDDERIAKLTARNYRGIENIQSKEPEEIIGKPIDPRDRKLIMALVQGSGLGVAILILSAPVLQDMDPKKVRRPADSGI